jgi:hypothetical protein
MKPPFGRHYLKGLEKRGLFPILFKSRIQDRQAIKLETIR